VEKAGTHPNFKSIGLSMLKMEKVGQTRGREEIKRWILWDGSLSFHPP
jgi:hypothetical protein